MKRGIQLLSLGIFTIFFFANAYGEKFSLPVDLFLKIDPLLSITSCLSARQFHFNLLLSLFILVSALIAGRFFCGYICPLGTLLDLGGKKNREKNHELRKIKYYLLTFLLVASLLSFNLAHIFDPIAFLTRVYTFSIYPFVVFILNLSVDAFRPAAQYFNFILLSHVSFKEPVFYFNIITIIMFIAIIALNTLSRRFWCRNLCPLGALLGFVARFGILKRHVNNNCNNCMKCRDDCPMGAIPEKPQMTAEDECIFCRNCSKICPQSAVSFDLDKSLFSHSKQPFNLNRRWFLFSAGGGAVAVLSRGIEPVSKLAQGRLIRPPGSLPEKDFLQMCVRCGECMKVCPTNTLQPSLFESGLEGIWSPRLSPRLAGCDQTCALCGTVCPTDAIRSLSLEEKKHAKLGTAYIDRNRCLVWAQDRQCFICDEQCPYNAIVFRWEDSSRRPFVVDNKCNGCGFCEEQCPVQGESAIIVTPQNEIRLASGSYVKKAEELNLVLKNDPGDDRFFFEDSKTENEGTDTSNKAPQGFIIK
jgi:ferredoxin-type protein NapF